MFFSKLGYSYMGKFSLHRCICFLCILKTCHVLDFPHIDGRIIGNFLEFNCSTGLTPLGQTVEIVENNISQFTIAHFNTTCTRKYIQCKPSDCSCTSNWFQWKVQIENPTTILQVQCLMRYPENKREPVKATIAFNGTYFWDYLAYQTLTSQEINFTSTTKVFPDTSSESKSTYSGLAIGVGIGGACAIICLLLLCIVKRRRSYRNRTNLPSTLPRPGDQPTPLLPGNRRRKGTRRNFSSILGIEMRARKTPEPNE